MDGPQGHYAKWISQRKTNTALYHLNEDLKKKEKSNF